MSKSCLSVDIVCSGSWFIMIKDLILNVIMFTMLLHLSKLCLGWGLNCVEIRVIKPASCKYVPCLVVVTVV